ncbi:SDR family oxidoreductase, partial [Xenorhabdus sp. NBAII XenSa04]
IINISSVAGRKNFPNHTVYVGTKFAVHGMSENLREELSKHNIRVTIIAPGAVETELLSHTSDKKIKE